MARTNPSRSKAAAATSSSTASKSTRSKGAASNSRAAGRPPPQVPWTAEEDAILIRLMVSYCGIQEYQCKLWGYFEHECKERGVRIPAERDLLDVIRRVHVLQKDHLKYKITLQNVKTLYWGTDRGPLWEDKGGESSSSRAIEGASRSNEEEEEESDSDEEEVVEVVKVKKKKQAKVVEVEESEDDEEEEEDAEEEANAGHSQAEHHVEAEGASQQRNSQTDAAARTAANNQDDTPRGAKRNATFLIEAGGKRMRIGMPPKGTEIIFDPKDETVRIKF